MRNYSLTLLRLFGASCLLGAACAPEEADHEQLTQHEWLDADTPDTGSHDSDSDPESEDAGTMALPGPRLDAGPRDAAVPSDAQTSMPPARAVGSDAGTSDAGTARPDASVPKDAGTTDAGTTKPDAGTTKPDAGSTDAGTTKPDAGTTDAGTKPDAGTTDAGTKPDAGTTDAGTKPDAGTTDAGTTKPPTTTFTKVYAIIWKHCAFCHVADHIGFQLGHLDMSSQDKAYQNLVNVSAAGIDCGGTGQVRVKPGDPTKSLIIHKLEGTADCGVRMPDNYPALSDTQIEVFRSWIRAGAKND
ncbi:MAG: hypothetical protein QM778_29710 [Myxococcales bacterium]